MEPAQSRNISSQRAAELAACAGIPPVEVSLAFQAVEMTPQEALRTMCALTEIVGRLSVREGISFDESTKLLEKATRIAASLTCEAFQAWFNSRDESDFAIGRNFINYQRTFAQQHSAEVERVMKAFADVVRARAGDENFDVYADAMETNRGKFLTLDLVNVRPPFRRNNLN